MTDPGTPQDPSAQPSAADQSRSAADSATPDAPRYPSTTPPSAPQYDDAAPRYDSAPQYGAQAGYAPQYGGGPAAPVPGKTMGIVAFVMAFIPALQLFALIFGIIALVQSRRAGAKNGLALAAIIISVVAGIILTIGVIALIAFAVAGTTGLCTQLGGSGTYVYGGQEIVCP